MAQKKRKPITRNGDVHPRKPRRWDETKIVGYPTRPGGVSHAPKEEIG